MLNIILLGITSFFTDVSSEMVYPLLPFFVTSTLGAGPAALGLIEGIAESLASLLKVFSGYISDRVGKRKGLTVLGYFSSTAGKALLLIANSWGMVLGARAVDRLGKGIRTAPRDALIAESAPPGGRGMAFGLHRGMDTAGAVIGVGLAWLIVTGAQPEFRRVFLWSILPAAIGVLLLAWVKEASPAARPGVPRPALRWRVLPKKLRLFLLIALLFSLGNSSNTFLLLRSSGPLVDARHVLLLYLVYNISYMGWSYPAGRLSDRIGRGWVLAAGYVLYGLVYFGFALADPAQSAWLPWVLFPCYGLYSGITDGVEKAFVVDMAPADIRATAIGVHATIAGAGLLPASILAGLVWEKFGPAAPFFIGGTAGLAAAGGILMIVRK